MAQPLAKPKFRRIVTKHDASGKAAIWIDADATNHKFPNEKITSTLMWSTDCTPTRLLSDEDEGDRIGVCAAALWKSFYDDGISARQRSYLAQNRHCRLRNLSFGKNRHVFG